MFNSKFVLKNRFNRSKINENVRSSNDCDISHKIKTLESEGQKIRNQVEDILHESSQLQSSRTSAMTMESSSTINDDSEKQAFRNDKERNNDNKSLWLNRKSKYNENKKVIEDAEIKEYKERIDSLQKLQKKDLASHQQEKEKLCDKMKELKRENYRLQDDFEKQMKEFYTKEAKYESMTERMRFNLEKLLLVNKEQEETLGETVSKLRDLDFAESTLKAIELLRNLFIDIEYYRGSTLAQDNDVESCHPIDLIKIVEKCFKEYNFDLENRSRKIKDLEDEIIQIKRTLSHDKEMSLQALQNEVECIQEENNNLKHHVDEMNENAERKIQNLKEDYNNIHNKLEEEMKNAAKIISELEYDVKELLQKNKKLNELNAEIKKSFENMLDDNEKQIASLKVERDKAINQKSSITAKLDASQNQLSETESNLLQLQSDKYNLEKESETFKKYIKEMEESIKCCRKYFESILKSIPSLNFDVDNFNNNYENSDINISNEESEIQYQVWKPKKYQIEEIILWLQSLRKKDKEADCKYEKLQKEYDSIQKQLEVVDYHKRNLEQSFKSQQLQIDKIKSENIHINGLIVNRNDEIERLTAERNYYFQLVNEKTEELTTIKSDKHRLVISLEERCKFLENQKNNNQNNDSENQIINTSLGKHDILKEERNKLTIDLREAKVAYEDILKRYENDSSQLQKLRRENDDLHTSLKLAQREQNELIADNKRMLIKFKDSEIEVTNLCRELQNNSGVKSGKHASLEKKVAELTTELFSTKNELKIAQENIKYFYKGKLKPNLNASQDINISNMTGSAPVADNLVLTKTRLRNLEEQMIHLETSQKDLKDENHKLMDLLKKVTTQNEIMSEELEGYVEENSQLRAKVQLLNVENTYREEKIGKISKKLKDESNYINNDIESKRIVEPFLGSQLMENNESMKQLREDLQNSIKDAKHLLSHSPLTSSIVNKLAKKEDACGTNKDFRIRNVYDRKHLRSSNNESGSNNNNINKSEIFLNSDMTNSSINNSLKSETMYLTEADRHVNFTLNKVK